MPAEVKQARQPGKPAGFFSVGVFHLVVPHSVRSLVNMELTVCTVTGVSRAAMNWTTELRRVTKAAGIISSTWR